MRTEIEPLLDLLRERDIIVRTASDTLPLGLGIASSIEREIENADFLCGVLSLEGDLQNVFYELGFAHGKRKPVFLVIEGKWPLPTDLSLNEMPYVRAPLRDRAAIEFALEQFVSNTITAVERKTIKAKPAPPKFSVLHRPKAEADHIHSCRQFLKSLDKELSGREIEFHFAKLLRTLGGVEVVERDQPGDKGVDMVLWVDALRSTIGNPILVEVKTGEISDYALDRAEQQLRSQVDVTRAAAGLLVYHGRTAGKIRPSSAARPLVMRFELRNLTETLCERSLARTIVSERNRITHLGK